MFGMANLRMYAASELELTKPNELLDHKRAHLENMSALAHSALEVNYNPYKSNLTEEAAVGIHREIFASNFWDYKVMFLHQLPFTV